MILDSLQAAGRYTVLHPGFKTALAALRDTDWRGVPLGRRDIDGDRLFALVARDAGRGHAGAPLESHRKYIDIQYVALGTDEMGWRALADCRRVKSEYDAGRDILFFADEPATWFSVNSGELAIFFPTDAHAPLAGSGNPLKVVMKVAVDW